MKLFIPKILYPMVGLILLYSDSLYLYSDERASVLKKRFDNITHSHKNEFIKILRKNPSYIPKSISYITWSQLILEAKEFFDYFGRLKKIYKEDKKFQRYVKKDIGKNKINQNEVDFILEEILIFYLISKGRIRLYNEYVQDRQKWILQCYPGKPLLSEIYLFQENFFRFNNPKNIYENSFYDLNQKKLYDYKRVDLENF